MTTFVQIAQLAPTGKILLSMLPKVNAKIVTHWITTVLSANMKDLISEPTNPTTWDALPAPNKKANSVIPKYPKDKIHAQQAAIKVLLLHKKDN